MRRSDRQSPIVYDVAALQSSGPVSRPRILLLDEPAAGMNPAEILELAEQIKSLHPLGLTILLIERKLDVVTASLTRSCCQAWRRNCAVTHRSESPV